MTLIKATLYEHMTPSWWWSPAYRPQAVNATIATWIFIMLRYISPFQPEYVAETVSVKLVILTFYNNDCLVQ